MLHGISAGDSLMVIALVHNGAKVGLTAVQILRNQEIMDTDLNSVRSALQNEIATELNRGRPDAAQVTS
jgi:hypothetical protein